MINKICKFCNKNFKVHSYREKSSSFCSGHCYNTHRSKQAYNAKKCPYCDAQFLSTRETRNHKYCSLKCSILGRRKYKDSSNLSQWRGEKECPQCKKIYKYTGKQIHQKFCSIECNIKSRAYSRDQSFFRKIDSEAKAYVLGVIFSDGCIYQGRYLNISSKDREFVNMCRSLLKSSAPIHTYKNSHSLIIGDQKIYASLIKLGVKERKSWKEYIIPRIPQKLFWHFLRGVFDGDGSFFIDKRDKYKYLAASFTCNSKKFLNDIRTRLLKSDISSHNIRFDRKPNNTGSWQLRIASRGAVKSFVEHLYNNSNYHLERKFKIAHNFYE